MSIKWILFVLIVLMGIVLFEDTPINSGLYIINKDPGAMYVSVRCTTDARGVTFCRDSKTGRSWTINPSPVGTSIRT